MSNTPMRRLEDLSEAEQIAVLDKMKSFLLDVLCEKLKDGTIAKERLTDHEKNMVATHKPHTETPSAVNWNSAPELDAASVVAEAEAILLGCCPACGSSNVQSSTQNGARLYDCLDCGHSWEG